MGSRKLNVWCSCSCHDLAMEDMFKCLPELTIWSANLTVVSTYYRTSGLRTKELINIDKNAKSYSPHHEIRFTQHLIFLCESILDNLDSSRQHWQNIIDSTVAGFLATWKTDSPKNQLWLTAIMIDICSVFRYIEKECQIPEIIAPDILKYRDIAINKLNMMADMPYPGGGEEKINPSSTEGGNSSSRRVRNTNVTAMGRSTESIRTELIQSAKNYLEERLDNEQSLLLQSIINLTSSRTAAEFIAASLLLFDVCNVDDKDAFISSVLEHFDDMRPSSDISSKDYDVKIDKIQHIF